MNEQDNRQPSSWQHYKFGGIPESPLSSEEVEIIQAQIQQATLVSLAAHSDYPVYGWLLRGSFGPDTKGFPHQRSDFDLVLYADESITDSQILDLYRSMSEQFPLNMRKFINPITELSVETPRTIQKNQMFITEEDVVVDDKRYAFYGLKQDELNALRVLLPIRTVLSHRHHEGVAVEHLDDGGWKVNITDVERFRTVFNLYSLEDIYTIYGYEVDIARVPEVFITDMIGKFEDLIISELEGISEFPVEDTDSFEMDYFSGEQMSSDIIELLGENSPEMLHYYLSTRDPNNLILTNSAFLSLLSRTE